MDFFLDLRNSILAFYRRISTPLIYIFKFVSGIFIFNTINHFFVRISVEYSTGLNRTAVVVLAALLTAVLPSVWSFVLMWLFISTHLFFVSPELSVIISLTLLCFLFFYIRIFPEESAAIIVLLVLFYLKIPYVVPLFMGLFSGVYAMGVFVVAPLIWFGAALIKSVAHTGKSFSQIDVLELPKTFSEIYKQFLDMMTDNTQWAAVAVIFVITFLSVKIVSSLSFDYSKEWAIVIGGITAALGAVFAVILDAVHFSLLGSLLSIIVSVAIVFVCKFFDCVSDYKNTERVTFDDDDYTYYVKAVPKVK